MNVFFQTETNRNLWIGSSDAPAIINISPWKTEYMLYQEKIGILAEDIAKDKQKLFNRGKRWEPIVVEMLVDELEDRGHDVQIIARNNRYIDPEHQFLAAEIDLEIMLDGEHVNGEMKTVHPFAAKDWGQQDTDEIPIYYTAQVLHAQMVTGKNRTIVAALIGADDLRVHVVYRDDELIQLIREKEIEFWKRIQNRNPPQITDLKDIRKIYAHDVGTTIEADDRVFNLITKLQRVKHEISRLEHESEDLEVEIKKFMGENSVLQHGGKPILTWKNNKDSYITQWKEAFDYLVSKSSIDQATLNEAIKVHSKVVPGARVFKMK